MATFTLHARTSAPPDVVFDTLTDHAAYADFTPVRSSNLERAGDPVPNGVGAIRALRVVGPALREQTIEYDRPHSFSYRLISGLPVRDYVGAVGLSADGSGTQITYRVDVTPSVPVPSGVVVALVRPAIQLLLRGAVKESERRAGRY
jgi:hypothetical protein